MSDWLDECRQWVGRKEETLDVIAPAPVVGLAATLDHASPPWRENEVPPLGHWCYFLPRARQSALGPDGHEKRGGFLPPVPLPRRMWAGGRLWWHRPLPLNATARKVSTIQDVTRKQGRSGELGFVVVAHEVFVDDELCLREEHDIVYREAAREGSNAPAAPARPDQTPEAEWTRTVTPDPVLLFRYSALTFNGHRIHFDREWCVEEEGYPGLVVHGPLTATLLVDLYLRHHPGAAVASFSFRAKRPLFDTAAFTLCGRPTEDGAQLWALTPEGQVAMEAELTAG